MQESLGLEEGSRLLVVMRHAKAEGFDKPDVQRALAQRGVRDADATGQWLAELGLTPDLALVSAATRTRETWAAVAEGAGWSVAADVSEALYNAGPETALDLIRETSDDVGALVVIGHNPTMAYLASVLDDGEGDGSPELARGFPTSAVAVFEVRGSWAAVDESGCRLVGFHVPPG